jgi:hypothetical protein
MKKLSILIISLCAFSSTLSAEIRELPPIKGSPQIITTQNVKLMPVFRMLSESSDIADKQMLIDCLEYSFDPYISDELRTLEEQIPALGLAEKTMGELEIPLVVFSALKTSNPALKNRYALLIFKLTKGQPVSYGQKLGVDVNGNLGRLFGAAESAPELDELAFFEGFSENPKMLEFLNKLDRQE